jgi:hypothetical protein
MAHPDDGIKPSVQTEGARHAAGRRAGVEFGLLALSATAAPIGLLALWRLGRFGGLLLELAGAALGARAGMMVAAGAGRRLRPVPRLLLFAETALDGLAVVAGFWAWVWRPYVRRAPRKRVGQVGRVEMGNWVTPVAVAAWVAGFVVHTVRMAIYISPTRGLVHATDV